jgi:hypothetical protein
MKKKEGEEGKRERKKRKPYLPRGPRRNGPYYLASHAAGYSSRAPWRFVVDVKNFPFHVAAREQFLVQIRVGHQSGVFSAFDYVLNCMVPNLYERRGGVVGSSTRGFFMVIIYLFFLFYSTSQFLWFFLFFFFFFIFIFFLFFFKF